MKTIEIDDGTYELVLKMARLTDETMEYILYRSVTREYVQGDEYRECSPPLREGLLSRG